MPNDALALRPLRVIVRHHFGHILFLISLDWVAHFLHFASFGLYEDDWYFSVGPYIWGGASWAQSLLEAIRQMVGGGRPLQLALAYLYGYIGAAFASLQLLYLIAYGNSVGCIILLYAVLRQRFASEFCLVAGTIFVLSPLTTIRQFANAAFTFYPAYILVFAAMLLYLRKQRWASYAMATGALLTYESIFMLFLGAPLLQERPRGRRRIAVHLAVCSVLFFGFSLIRMVASEPRALSVVNESKGALLLGVMAHIGYNALNIAALYGRALYMATREYSLDSLVYSSAFALLIGWYLTRRIAPTGESGRPGGERPPGGADGTALRSAVGVGAAFVVLGLSLSYFVLPGRPLDGFIAMGRSTRVFASAEFGASIVVAAVWWAAIRANGGRQYQRGVRVAGGAFVTALFAYCFVVQQDYIEVWRRQQSLIAQAMLLTPDIQPNSTIMLKINYPDNRFLALDNRRRAIGDEHAMFGQVFYFLFEGERKPKVFFVYSDQWKDYLTLGKDGQLDWTASEVPHRWDIANPPLTAGRVILLDASQGGRVTRRNGPLAVDGSPVTQPHLSLPSNWARFRASRLFGQMLPDVIPELPDRGTR